MISKETTDSVKVCIIDAIVPYLNFDRETAVGLFRKACEGDELVRGTEQFANFVKYAAATHYGQLRDILRGGLASNNESVQAKAAQQITLANLSIEDAENQGVTEDAAEVRQGNAVTRVAAASVYAMNANDPEVGGMCREYLSGFFDDDEDEVRSNAANCLHALSGDADLDAHQDFIDSYIESQAFPHALYSLLQWIEESTSILPDVVLNTAEKFIQSCGDRTNLSDMVHQDTAMTAKLVLRVYSQKAADVEIRRRCLDVIDDMEKLGMYGMGEELSEFDR